MMVVHEDNETPVDVSVIRQPLLEQKSYVIVKNHVRELTNNSTSSNEIKHSVQNTDNDDKQSRNRKSQKLLKKIEEMPTTSIESNFQTNFSTELDPTDLEELKTVYKKCKEVMKRIETKYGHFLDSETESGRKQLKRKQDSETEDECTCQMNKKILFDDDGRQLIVDNKAEQHICIKNKKPDIKNKNIIIEEPDIVLPDSLQDLGIMLHDPNIDKPHRNKILQKIRSVKQEYVNEIKFNKHILIEKLKSNPDDMLDFKGTNLSTLPGYS